MSSANQGGYSLGLKIVTSPAQYVTPDGAGKGYVSGPTNFYYLSFSHNYQGNVSCTVYYSLIKDGVRHGQSYVWFSDCPPNEINEKHAPCRIGELRIDRMRIERGREVLFEGEPHIEVTRIQSPRKNDCFVATACFEDARHPTVDKLRGWRDETLAKSKTGRAFIAAYNRVGPRAARVVNYYPRTKPYLRRALTRIANQL